nr:hypothetical protein [Bradyrhizobium nanningense]
MRQHSPSDAANEANSLLKETVKKVTSEYEQAEQAFHANRERLKAERLAREAERRRQPDRAP